MPRYQDIQKYKQELVGQVRDMEPDIKIEKTIEKPFNRNDYPATLYNGYFQEPEKFNPLLGYPLAPIIGRYGGAGYNLNTTLLHTNLLVRYQNKQCIVGEEKITIPQSVLKILTEIPELIPHNKPPKKNINIQNGKGLSNKEEPKDDADQPQNHIEFHPFSFKFANTFKFRFLISIEENPSKKPNEFMNYVNHCYVFTQFDFSQTKKLVEYLPSCLIEPVQGNSGVKEWQRDYKSLKFGSLRSEYLSFHLKKGAPAFSPNNFKIGIDPNTKMIHFFAVTLLPTEYSINYHWHFIDKSLATTVQQIVSNSRNLMELIHILEAELGNSSYLFTLRKIFGL